MIFPPIWKLGSVLIISIKWTKTIWSYFDIISVGPFLPYLLYV